MLVEQVAEPMGLGPVLVTLPSHGSSCTDIAFAGSQR